MSDRSDGPSFGEVLREKYNLRVCFISLALLFLGCIVITGASFLSASIPDKRVAAPEEAESSWTTMLEILSDIFRDLGIAVLVAGVLAVTYDQWVREDYRDDSKHVLKAILREDSNFLDQCRRSGLRGIHPRLSFGVLDPKFDEIKQKAQENTKKGKPKPKLKILQTWMAGSRTELLRGIVNNQIRDAAEAGCEVWVLYYSPGWEKSLK